MANFPADLIYHVLDCIPDVTSGDDIKAEQSKFSLLSRTWRDRARERLFSDINYSFRRPPNGTGWDGTQHYCDDRRWGQLFGEHEDTPYKTLSMLVDFFRGHQDCASYVKSLDLVAYPVQWRQSDSDWGWTGYFTAEDRVEASLLAALLGLLPNLETLDLHNVVPSHPLPHDGLISHPSLDTLTMAYNSSNTSTLDPQMLLGCFVKIPAVFLVGVGDDTGGEWTATPPQDSSLSIQYLSLNIMRSTPPGVLEMLMRSPTVHDLHTLALKDIDQRLLPILQNFVYAVSPNLKTFDYELMTTRMTETVNQHLDLSRCTNLEELKITFDIPLYDGTLLEPNLRMVASILSSMEHTNYPALKEVILEALIDYEGVDPPNPSQDTDESSQASSTSSGAFEPPPSIRDLERSLLSIVSRSSTPSISFICVSDPCLEKEQETEEMISIWFPTLSRENKLEVL